MRRFVLTLLALSLLLQVFVTTHAATLADVSPPCTHHAGALSDSDCCGNDCMTDCLGTAASLLASVQAPDTDMRISGAARIIAPAHTPSSITLFPPTPPPIL